MAYLDFYGRFYSLRDKTKAAWRSIFHLKATLIYVVLFIVWQLIIWGQAIFIKNSLSGDLIVLHYNVDFGIDWVARPDTLFILPILPVIVFLINLLLLFCLYNNKNLKILVHYLLGGAILFAALISLVMLSVYLINFR